MLAIVLALCSAVSNAIGSVYQRRAALDIPDRDAMSFRLIADLLRRPVWLIGIAGVTGGFLFQAAALSQGTLVLVQPLLVAELPLTLLLAIPVLGHGPGRRGWAAAGALSGGLALLLASAAPRPGGHLPTWYQWLLALLSAVGLAGTLVVLSRTERGALRTALLGMAAGVGFGVTAAVIKVTTISAGHGVAALFTSWPVYVMLTIGTASFFLLQNAYQAGSLVFAEPAVSIADPVVAFSAGILLFHDHVRSGGWIALELLGVALMVWGTIHIARSPAFAEGNPGEADTPDETAHGDRSGRPRRKAR